MCLSVKGKTMNIKYTAISTLCLSMLLITGCSKKTEVAATPTTVQQTPQSTSPLKPDIDRISLLGTWQVESIENKPVIDRSPARFTFNDKQQVNGSASCNNFSTRYLIDGHQLTISPSAVTRKMCTPVLMNQENQFLAALMKVKTYKLEQQMLYLFDDEDNLLFKASKQLTK